MNSVITRFLLRLVSFCFFCLCTPIMADDDNPCDGLLAIINRPTVVDSTCVVPANDLVLEMGYAYYRLQGGFSSQSYPEMQVRWGLWANSEINLYLPYYVQQSEASTSGWTAAVVGVKHMFCTTKKSVFSMEALFTLPSGSQDQGSAGLGTTLNALYSYALTKKLGISVALGVSSLTEPRDEGGDRYTSINPDVIIIYDPTDKLQYFFEVYGQTKTAPDQGSAAMVDAGIQYLIRKTWEIDLSVGQRLYGQLFGGFTQYISLGMGFLFN